MHFVFKKLHMSSQAFFSIHKQINIIYHINKLKNRASLVAQWWRSPLETCVKSMDQEDPTSRGATKPMHHNYWVCTLEPRNHNYWARASQQLKPAYPRACTLQQETPPQRDTHILLPHSMWPQLEKVAFATTREKSTPQWRSGTAKDNK